MKKDWTGSAMPSIVKGFAMIGQPFKTAEFKDAFGYDMPEVTYTEDEKRYLDRNGFGESPKTVQPTFNPEPGIKNAITEPAKTEQNGIQEQNRSANPQSSILHIDISGVGNKPQKEERQETTGKKEVSPAQVDPYMTKILKDLNNLNETQNRAQHSNRMENGQNRIVKKESSIENRKAAYPTGRTGPSAANNPGETLQDMANRIKTNLTNYLNQTGENENADNIAAQPDPDGKHANALDPIRENVNRATKEFVEKSGRLYRQQQENEETNHLANWITDVGNHMKEAAGHPDQSYLEGYKAILTHDANKKLAEHMAEPIQTRVNGKEKYEIVRDAFTHEFITDTNKQAMALGSLINHGIEAMNGGTPINPELTKQIDENMLDLFKQSDRYIAQSVPIEKIRKQIIEGDDAGTADNFTRFGYEVLGEKGPYLGAGIATGSLTAGAGMAGAAWTTYKVAKEFGNNLAEANANIIRKTGRSDWELAFKIAMQTTIGGRVIDNQMQKAAQGRGLAGKTLMEIFNNAIKKRFNSMVNDWNINKDKNQNDKFAK